MAAGAYVGLGSNLGDRLSMLRLALAKLRQHPEITLESRWVSSLWETEPVGSSDFQPNYYNAVVRLDTTSPPVDLLRAMQTIECELGRVRRHRNESREIDLDLLFYDQLVLDTPELVVPHPRLHQRRFVLEPLCEIAGDLVHPVLGVTVADLRAAARDDASQPVRHVMDARWAAPVLAKAGNRGL